MIEKLVEIDTIICPKCDLTIRFPNMVAADRFMAMRTLLDRALAMIVQLGMVEEWRRALPLADAILADAREMGLVERGSKELGAVASDG